MSAPGDAFIARMAEQRDLLHALHEQCQSISVRISSRDQSVSVAVDATGAMTGLWLAPKALKLGSEVLATLIVDTAHAAAQVIIERQDFLLTEFARRTNALAQPPPT